MGESCTSDIYIEPALFIGIWVLMLASKTWDRVRIWFVKTFSDLAEQGLHFIRRTGDDIQRWKEQRKEQKKRKSIVDINKNIRRTSSRKLFQSTWNLDEDEMSDEEEIGFDVTPRRDEDTLLGIPPRPCVFYWEIRTFSKFCQQSGVFSTENLAFVEKEPQFYFHYDSSHYWTLFTRLTGGVLAITWRHALMSALWAGLLEWAYFHIKCRYEHHGETLNNMLQGVVSVHESLLPLVSFLLTMYVTDRMDKHTLIIQRCWQLRCKMLTLTLFVGTILRSNSHANICFKYTLWRHLTMLHFFVYEEIADILSPFTEAHWAHKGLLSHREKRLLAKSTTKVEQLFSWIAYQIGHTDCQMSDRERLEMLRLTVNVRGSCTELKDITTWMPPISEAQLITVTVEFFITITPMALTMRSIDSESPAYVWNMTGSACLTLFFIGLLNMVNIVEDPFGEDLDDLNPDSLLLTAERQMQVYLMAATHPAAVLRKVHMGLSALTQKWDKATLDSAAADVCGEDSDSDDDMWVCPCSIADTPDDIYHVKIHTGDVTFAGTDAAVWIIIHGVGDDVSPKIMLDNSLSNKDPFERDKIDVFTFPVTLTPPEITSIEVGHEGGGQAAAWFLDKVDIISAHTGASWQFDCYEWIDITTKDPGWRAYNVSRRRIPDPLPRAAVCDDCLQGGQETRDKGQDSVSQPGVNDLKRTTSAPQAKTSNAMFEIGVGMAQVRHSADPRRIQYSAVTSCMTSPHISSNVSPRSAKADTDMAVASSEAMDEPSALELDSRIRDLEQSASAIADSYRQSDELILELMRRIESHTRLAASRADAVDDEMPVDAGEGEGSVVSPLCGSEKAADEGEAVASHGSAAGQLRSERRRPRPSATADPGAEPASHTSFERHEPAKAAGERAIDTAVKPISLPIDTAVKPISLTIPTAEVEHNTTAKPSTVAAHAMPPMAELPAAARGPVSSSVAHGPISSNSSRSTSSTRECSTPQQGTPLQLLVQTPTETPQEEEDDEAGEFLLPFQTPTRQQNHASPTQAGANSPIPISIPDDLLHSRKALLQKSNELNSAKGPLH